MGLLEYGSAGSMCKTNQNIGRVHRCITRVPMAVLCTTGEPVRPAQVLHKAHDMNKKVDVKRRGVEYFVNCSHFRGQPVTDARIRQYVMGLGGLATLKKNNRYISVVQYQRMYMSLHLVQWDASFQLEEGQPKGLWTCDCKGFWHALVCSHIVLVQIPDWGVKFRGSL
jgi:hypothetical protein